MWDLGVHFAEVVAQLGIEPMTTRCLVVALATKLLGWCDWGIIHSEFRTGNAPTVLWCLRAHGRFFFNPANGEFLLWAVVSFLCRRE